MTTDKNNIDEVRFLYSKENKVDRLLMTHGAGMQQLALLNWKQVSQKDGLHDFFPDFHRLQQEYWLWENKARYSGKIVDIGVQDRRSWMGEDYKTLGIRDCDYIGDVQNMPFTDGELDVVICTDVLEHVTNPFLAMDEIYRCLKPGGLLMAASPFIWPFHGTDELKDEADKYPDYWRFTHEGWGLLASKFSETTIMPCNWTDEGLFFYDMLRKFEGFGFMCFTRATTGYLVEAIK